jgi:predicted enzyme related to lactoylglutathione lyase
VVTAGSLTVLLTVREIERSIAFYSLLGFETIDVERADGRMVWARIHCEGGGAIMFVVGGEEEDRQRAHMYLYTEDLPALKNRIEEAGVEAGEIYRPHYMPSGEICITDPDGNVILIGHWGAAEHEQWERQLAAKRAAGLL